MFLFFIVLLRRRFSEGSIVSKRIGMKFVRHVDRVRTYLRHFRTRRVQTARSTRFSDSLAGTPRLTRIDDWNHNQAHTGIEGRGSVMRTCPVTDADPLREQYIIEDIKTFINGAKKQYP